MQQLNHEDNKDKQYESTPVFTWKTQSGKKHGRRAISNPLYEREYKIDLRMISSKRKID